MDEESASSIFDIFRKFLSLFSKRGGKREAFREEVRNLIDAGEEEGIIDEEAGEWIESIIDFRDILVREVMIPRPDMVCLSREASVDIVLKTALSSGHSRIPVYKDSLDDIIGIFFVKDLLREWGKPADEVNWARWIRKPYFVPETMHVSYLLKEFKKKHCHMAIVIDEYGGTAGLVTIEDIIEEIFGEIRDEHDVDEERIVEANDGYLLVDARTNINDLENFMGIQIPKEDFETIGGLVISMAGRVPKPGEKIRYNVLDIIVEESDDKRVKKVKIKEVPEEKKSLSE